MRRFIHEPVTLAVAQHFVSVHHRHHTPAIGHKFSLGCWDRTADRLCGVAIVGRPVSRGRDDGWGLEVTRLCTDGTKDAASFLLGACARATHALGYLRLGTYTLASESGASLRGAGWRCVSQVEPRSWDTPSRRRTDKTEPAPRLLWEASF